MQLTNWKTTVFAAASLGLIGSAQGDQITDMQAQIDSLRAELSEVKTEQGDNWLNERRAEEVKGLIMEVLSDADTRASLLNDGAVAGYDGKGFFIASQDDAFTLRINGQLQFRYIWNSQDDADAAPDGDEDVTGFQTRRAKVKFSGHISSPKITYKLVLAHERSDGNSYLEAYSIGYAINDSWKIQGGNMKLPFLREELVSSSKQLAAERSTTNEYFTLNRSEGIQLTWAQDNTMVRAMTSDGANSDIEDFDDDSSEFAITARLDHAWMGTLKQAKDFTGWDGEEASFVTGGAVHYELGDGRKGGDADYFAHTVDASYERDGFNAYVAYIGASIDPDSDADSDRDMVGFVAQGGLDIVPDKFELFVRWAYIDGDEDSEEEAETWTFGGNYYINGHKTKFTADVIWLTEDLPTSNSFGASADSSSLGLITGTEDEIAVRTQFQLLF